MALLVVHARVHREAERSGLAAEPSLERVEAAQRSRTSVQVQGEAVTAGLVAADGEPASLEPSLLARRSLGGGGRAIRRGAGLFLGPAAGQQRGREDEARANSRRR
ncbi:MAG TPA: hypothetical protein VF574_05625 [Allosphingosinicella sp.]